MDFQATITDHRTGEVLAYNQDTLDEFAAELRLRKISAGRSRRGISGPSPFP